MNRKLSLFLVLCVTAIQLPQPLHAAKGADSASGWWYNSLKSLSENTLHTLANNISEHPYLALGGSAALATGLYLHKPIIQKGKAAKNWAEKKLRRPLNWASSQFNQQHWIIRSAMAAPISLLLSAVICRYAALVPMPGTTWDTLTTKKRRQQAHNILFGTLSLYLFQKISGTLQELRNTISGQTDNAQNPADMGELIEEFPDELSPEDLVLMSSEDELVHYIEDLAAGKIKNLLLMGPSNTGKTFFVKDLANALNRPLYILDASKGLFQGKFFGDVQQKFAQLRTYLDSLNLDRGSIVCLDEVDTFIRAQGDGEHQNLQIATNKQLMDLQNTLAAKGIILIMLTNETNPENIKDQISNRILRIIKDENGVVSCHGGYIVPKQNPNEVARTTICKRTVEDIISTASTSEPVVFEDIPEFCIYISKFTKGCNNGEVVAIVRAVINALSTKLQGPDPLCTLISLRNNECLESINATLLNQLDKMIKKMSTELLNAINHWANVSQNNKEIIALETENLKNHITALKTLRSSLILYSYADPNIASAQELNKALHPHQERIGQLRGGLPSKQYAIDKAASELQNAVVTLWQGVTSGHTQYEAFCTNVKDLIEEALTSHQRGDKPISESECANIDTYLNTTKEIAQDSPNFEEMKKVREVITLWNACKQANNTLAQALKEKADISTEITQLQNEETKIGQDNQNATNFLNNPNINPQQRTEPYKDLCTKFTDVKNLYDNNKAVLPHTIPDKQLVTIAEGLPNNYNTYTILLRLGLRGQYPSITRELRKTAINTIDWFVPQPKKKKSLLLHKDIAKELAPFTTDMPYSLKVGMELITEAANKKPGTAAQWIDDEIVRRALCDYSHFFPNKNAISSCRDERGRLMVITGTNKIPLSKYATLHLRSLQPTRHVDI
ncbi:MAG: hypothetical protein UW09_C0001G0223 [candidate division TM6 bacterium GW2011_GWF2_43_87]|nr:MAG: hypothetical protein UW09_C0001G0223 [candidate division TM6 bacterium GW2011_GWF2_43_87]